MSQEASKIRKRFKAEGTYHLFINGKILDVGCGDDKISPWADPWDVEQGDAQTLPGVADKTYHTVFSSHCLEHLRDPAEALWHWWRVLKPGGFLVVQVPAEDQYEQGIWPSPFNNDHKHTFTLSKAQSWSPASVNLLELVQRLPGHNLIYAKVVDGGYDYSKMGADPPVDQTLGEAEAAVEVVVQKMKTHLPLRSGLKSLLLCPQDSCNRAALTLVGVDEDNKYVVRCGACGFLCTMGTL